MNNLDALKQINPDEKVIVVGRSLAQIRAWGRSSFVRWGRIVPITTVGDIYRLQGVKDRPVILLGHVAAGPEITAYIDLILRGKFGSRVYDLRAWAMP